MRQTMREFMIEMVKYHTVEDLVKASNSRSVVKNKLNRLYKKYNIQGERKFAKLRSEILVEQGKCAMCGK